MSNLLHALQSSLPANSHPSKSAIASLFHKYQEQRKPRMKVAFEHSYFLTRLQTCDGWLNRVTMMYLVPLLGFGVFANQLSDLCAGSPKFDFIPLKEKKPASVRWKDDDSPVVIEQKSAREKVMQVKDTVVMQAVALVIAAIFMEEAMRVKLKGLKAKIKGNGAVSAVIVLFLSLWILGWRGDSGMGCQGELCGRDVVNYTLAYRS